MSTTNYFNKDAGGDGHQESSTNQPVRRFIRPSELGEVEACLESVIVAGDLSSWASNLLQACEAEGAALREEIKENNQTQMVRLVSEDPNLAQRASQMQAEDAEILRLYDDFAGKVHRLQERAALAGPREDKLDEGIQLVIDEGLALVIRVRKQEKALSTWFSESIQRDNGVGD